MQRKKKQMSEAWWDAHWTDKGIGILTWNLARLGHEPSKQAIARYYAAKTRTDARRKDRTSKK